MFSQIVLQCIHAEHFLNIVVGPTLFKPLKKPSFPLTIFPFLQWRSHIEKLLFGFFIAATACFLLFHLFHNCV